MSPCKLQVERKPYESEKVHPNTSRARQADDPGTEALHRLNRLHIVVSASKPYKKSLDDRNGLLSEDVSSCIITDTRKLQVTYLWVGYEVSRLPSFLRTLMLRAFAAMLTSGGEVE